MAIAGSFPVPGFDGWYVNTINEVYHPATGTYSTLDGKEGNATLKAPLLEAAEEVLRKRRERILTRMLRKERRG